MSPASGNTHIVWKQEGSIPLWVGAWDMDRSTWRPGPCRRHLAIYHSRLSANTWMMENF